MISIFAAIALTLPAVDMKSVRAILAGSGPLTRGDRIVGARVRATIEPNGNVEDCRVLSFSGGVAGAEQLCRLFERQKITPAKDEQGIPIHAVFVTTIWAHPDRESALPPLPELPPVLEMTVDRVPTGGESPFTLSLGLLIDESGRTAACGALAEDLEAYSRAACEVLEKETFDILRDRKGTAVRYVMQAGARLSAAGEPAA